MGSRSRSACNALVLLLWLLPGPAAAAPVGEVTHVSGVCMVRKVDGSPKVLAAKTLVEQGDVVVTSYNAYVRLKFTDDAVVAIAREAMKRGAGAPRLRAVLEEVMLDVMYELPSLPGLKDCIITREVIVNTDRPTLISDQKDQSS